MKRNLLPVLASCFWLAALEGVAAVYPNYSLDTYAFQPGGTLHSSPATLTSVVGQPVVFDLSFTPTVKMIGGVLAPDPQPDPHCLSLACPTNIIRYTCSSNCVPVDFSLWATNLCNPVDLHVVTDHSSGDCFPLGTTMVHATAYGSGQSNSCRFSITVLSDPKCSAPLYGGVSSVLQGAALADARADGSLRLYHLGDSGLDGVRFDFGSVEGVRLDFDSIIRANNLPAGAVCEVTVRGDAGAPMGSLLLQRSIPYQLIETIPDFTGQGAATYGLRLYNGSTLLYESRNRTAPPANHFPLENHVMLTAQPIAIRASLRPDAGVVFEYSFAVGSSVIVFNNRNELDFLPDRMEIFAGPAGVVGVPLKLSGLDLRFSGISERVITGIALTKFGVEVRSSQGVLLAGANGELEVRTQPAPPALPLPVDPPAPGPWDLLNHLGYFTDLSPGNPSGYAGLFEVYNPLGMSGDWDVKIDLTDKATSPLGLQKYRPGKSSAELKLSLPTLAEGAKLRFVAGGAIDPLPGALTVEMGSLLFEGKGGRIELGGFFPIGPGDPIFPQRLKIAPTDGTLEVPQGHQRLEITLADGTVRRLEGTEGELRVSWDAAVGVPPVFFPVAIGPDGRLSMGSRSVDPSLIRLASGENIQVRSMNWTLAGPQPLPWNPGSLRGLLLVGDKVPAVSIQGLTRSADNPTEPSNFVGRRVQALGNASFRQDAFGSLVLSGLSQSAEDGIAMYNGSPITPMAPPGVPQEIASVDLGYQPVSGNQYPGKGARLDFQVRSAGGGAPTNAVLAGHTISPGGPYFFGVRFPGLQATHNTLRLFHGDQLRFEQKGRPSEAEDARGNLAPDAAPDHVAARVVNGQFMWIMSWNRLIYCNVGNSILADRVEIVTDDANSYPRDPCGVFGLRASNIGTLRLLNLGDRTAPLVPKLKFGFDAGKLNLDWAKSANGIPKLQVAPNVDGPWVFGAGEILPNGQRHFAMETIGAGGYTRLVDPELTEGCLNFSAEALGNRANLWEFAGWKFDRFRPDNSHNPVNEIIESGVSHALWFDGRMDIELPTPATGVDIGFIQLGPPIKFEAFDEVGQADELFVSSAPVTDHTQLVTLRARAGRPLRRLRITAAAKPVHLRELCLRAFQFSDAQESRECLPLRTAALGEVSNPWLQGDLTLTAHSADGRTPSTARISPYGGFLPGYEVVGYEVEYQVELKFAHPCPQVEIEFISGSGLIDFQAYDDLGAPLDRFHLDRVTATTGETHLFTGGTRPIGRIVITTPNDKTRLLKICCGPVVVPFCREVADLVVRPTRNPQPLGDTVWTLYDATGALASSALRTEAGETGLELTRETLIEFATDQLSVDLRIVVIPGGATLSAEASGLGGRIAASLPSTSYAVGVHTLTLTDYCPTGCGENIRRIRLKLPLGKAIVTRVCTPSRNEQ